MKSMIVRNFDFINYLFDKNFLGKNSNKIYD